jgi:TetR/AcrR family transcriptional regulator, transcriptional repressor for nem operon
LTISYFLSTLKKTEWFFIRIKMRKGERTKEFILEQSAALFNKQGYASTSLSDIMAATKLEKGGIYNHFANKEALMQEAFLFAVQQVETRYNSLLEDRRDSRSRLHAVLEVFKSFLTDPPVRGGCPMLNAAIEADDALPALRPSVRRALEGWRTAIKGILERGIARGELRRDLDPESFSSVMLASLEGAVMLSKMYRDPVHIERVLRFLELQIDGLEVRPYLYAGG